MNNQSIDEKISAELFQELIKKGEFMETQEAGFGVSYPVMKTSEKLSSFRGAVHKSANRSAKHVYLFFQEAIQFPRMRVSSLIF